MRKIEKRRLLPRDGGSPIALRLFLLADRDIANDGHGKRCALQDQGTKHDIDGEFAAIFAPGVKLQPGSHWPGVRQRGVPAAMFGMDRSESLGYEDFYGLPDQLLAIISKQALGLCVRQNNGSD